MLSFIHDLFETGSVVMPMAAEPIADDSPDLQRAIEFIDREARLDMAHTAPALSLPAAIWALRIIENACRFLVHREFNADAIAAALQTQCPADPSAARSYSADLFLRFLPDITRMAKGVGPGDPLVDHLRQIAASWPLSSVGMEKIDCDPDAMGAIVSHPGILQLYIDRIIDRADPARLTSPAIAQACRLALGAHPSLAPVISKSVEQYQEQF